MEHWRGTPLENLDVDEMDETFVEWVKKITLCVKNDVLKDFQGPMSFCTYIQSTIDNLKVYIPVLQLLKGRGMK